MLLWFNSAGACLCETVRHALKYSVHRCGKMIVCCDTLCTMASLAASVTILLQDSYLAHCTFSTFIHHWRL